MQVCKRYISLILPAPAYFLLSDQLHCSICSNNYLCDPNFVYWLCCGALNSMYLNLIYLLLWSEIFAKQPLCFIVFLLHTTNQQWFVKAWVIGIPHFHESFLASHEPQITRESGKSCQNSVWIMILPLSRAPKGFVIGQNHDSRRIQHIIEYIRTYKNNK